ncbi:MAG: 2-dehydropantoate 2-reductase [Desulfobacteraceae bacterium]|nr:2-dehydropantoate 2-reductase [Desulfobacteraceae bacterium]
MNKLNFLLIGTGAVGSYYMGKISRAGVHITSLSITDYEIIKKKGIQINSINKDFKFIPDKTIKSTSEYLLIPDYIIIATKALPEIDVIAMIKNIIHKKTTIVLLQNGIDIETKIFNAYPDNEVISGLAYITVNKIAPATINHQANGWLVIGKYPNGISKKTKLLSKIFNEAGVQCTLEKDINLARWKKLIWNASYNVISVLGGGLTTKEMTQSKEINSLITGIMKEVILLADKSGYKIDESLIDEYINFTSKMPANKTSMLLDYENKRPMEVEAILGNTIKMAKKINMAVPHLESLYPLLKTINQKNRKN